MQTDLLLFMNVSYHANRAEISFFMDLKVNWAHILRVWLLPVELRPFILHQLLQSLPGWSAV